jgi:hypothetical protein
MAHEPLLNLDTLIVRPTIKVDGISYELLAADELSILDSQRLTNWGKEIEALASADDDAGAEKLRELVSRLSRKVLVNMPDDVFATLTEAHRVAIAQVFTGLLLARKIAVAGALASRMLSPSTGAKSYPASSASMGGRPAGGSPKRRARSSGPS